MNPVEAHVIQLVRDFSQAMDSALRENKDEFTCPNCGHTVQIMYCFESPCASCPECGLCRL